MKNITTMTLAILMGLTVTTAVHAKSTCSTSRAIPEQRRNYVPFEFEKGKECRMFHSSLSKSSAMGGSYMNPKRVTVGTKFMPTTHNKGEPIKIIVLTNNKGETMTTPRLTKESMAFIAKNDI